MSVDDLSVDDMCVAVDDLTVCLYMICLCVSLDYLCVSVDDLTVCLYIICVCLDYLCFCR